jgi:hypothetical protein
VVSRPAALLKPGGEALPATAWRSVAARAAQLSRASATVRAARALTSPFHRWLSLTGPGCMTSVMVARRDSTILQGVRDGHSQPGLASTHLTMAQPGNLTLLYHLVRTNLHHACSHLNVSDSPLKSEPIT